MSVHRKQFFMVLTESFLAKKEAIIFLWTVVLSVLIICDKQASRAILQKHHSLKDLLFLNENDNWWKNVESISYKKETHHIILYSVYENDRPYPP